MSLQTLGGMSVDTKALLADLVGLEARQEIFDSMIKS